MNNSATPSVPDNINVSGTVTYEKGGALPGINVVLKNTQRGTTTDVNSTYRLVVPDQSTLLALASLGIKVRKSLLLPEQFSRVATAQDKGQIESYRAAHRHHIVKRSVCNVYEFLDLREASEIVRRFVNLYDCELLHSVIGSHSPNLYL